MRTAEEPALVRSVRRALLADGRPDQRVERVVLQVAVALVLEFPRKQLKKRTGATYREIHDAIRTLERIAPRLEREEERPRPSTRANC